MLCKKDSVYWYMTKSICNQKHSSWNEIHRRIENKHKYENRKKNFLAATKQL